LDIKDKKALLCVGDSHASVMYGKSWPDFLSSKLNLDLIRASSPGAGNSFYIEKLHFILKNHPVDLVVIQLTEPSRVVTGFSDHNPLLNRQYDVKTFSKENSKPYNDGCIFNDIKCYTWNAYSNEQNFKEISPITIDEFWSNYISTSKWIDYKILQDIFLMYSICKKFKTKVIFWSWFIDFDLIFNESYSWLKAELPYIDSFGFKILKDGGKQAIPNDGHYRDEPHEFLVETWLLPKIKKILDNDGTGYKENNRTRIH